MEASELEYLKWFFSHADFGPADGDVHIWMQEKFEEETGLEVPNDYKYE